MMNALSRQERSAGWSMLFDGKLLNGWAASDAPGTFSVDNGELVVHGPRSHLYYIGSVQHHDFQHFVLQLDVMTRPRANSGVYFHTEYQGSGWPETGIEVQVNNSHPDPSRTGGLYDIHDSYASVAQDNSGFTLTIRVNGKRVVTSVDGKVITDYREPDDFVPPVNHPRRRIAHGSFALQGHDPESETHYRNIKVLALR
jgi:Domain of Unknown Function (DUF1080)